MRTPFPPQINEESPVFKFYIEDIIHGIKIMGSVMDNDEAMRYRYRWF